MIPIYDYFNLLNLMDAKTKRNDQEPNQMEQKNSNIEGQSQENMLENFSRSQI